MEDRSKQQLDMRCECPRCGLHTPLEKGGRCIEKQCPSCGAALRPVGTDAPDDPSVTIP